MARFFGFVPGLADFTPKAVHTDRGRLVTLFGFSTFPTLSALFRSVFVGSIFLTQRPWLGKFLHCLVQEHGRLIAFSGPRGSTYKTNISEHENRG